MIIHALNAHKSMQVEFVQLFKLISNMFHKLFLLNFNNLRFDLTSS
jgi:hypothetical protein